MARRGEPSQERLATLELAIGRAPARCGSPHGLEMVIAYLDDVRALLAGQAHRELSAISGTDQGKDAEEWGRWLACVRSRLEPCPLQEVGPEHCGEILLA